MDTNSLGKFGEQQAALFLQKKGYKILEMNYSCRLGEIDIIAQNEKYIVFCEVKLRKNDVFGSGMEYVTKSKQTKVIRAAMMYMQPREMDRQPRFDVIEVYAPAGEGGEVEIFHAEDAFQCNYTL